MCGGTLGETLGLNTEQANKIATSNNWNTNEEVSKVVDYVAANVVSPIGGTIYLLNEIQKAMTPSYGSTSDNNNDTTDGDIPTEGNTPPPTTEMTPEERRNNLRRLMASRYGRAQTVLTGGTGISDFGI